MLDLERLFAFDHPIYRPLWMRLGLVALCLGWAVFEALTGSAGWAILFGACGAYLGWRLLLRHSSGKDRQT
ncbi:hypothetical protein [Thioclava kandeliae]|uniref:DUF3329 domain-containing protein n=1 Tax=Thioclava kandeliae TaxID=3070818 RepID=A0ABV1SJ52_9RHOB